MSQRQLLTQFKDQSAQAHGLWQAQMALHSARVLLDELLAYDWQEVTGEYMMC